VPTPLRDPLLALAGLLLLLDVAARRLSLRRERGGVVKATTPRGAPAPALFAPRPGPAADLALPEAAPIADQSEEAPKAAEQDAYVGGLLAARRKARDRQDRDGGPR